MIALVQILVSNQLIQFKWFILIELSCKWNGPLWQCICDYTLVWLSIVEWNVHASESEMQVKMDWFFFLLHKLRHTIF